jgi:nitroreductase
MPAHKHADQTVEARKLTELIYRRHSVRAYTAEIIDEPRLKALLEVAVHAPTAMRREPWRFVVVQNRALLTKLSDRAKEIAMAHAAQHGNVLEEPGTPGDGVGSPFADPDFDIFHGAGTLVVICAEPTTEIMPGDARPQNAHTVADCWLAAANFMLAASADGLGTCCIGFALEALNDAGIRTELGMAAGTKAIAPIIVGVPKEVPFAQPRRSAVILRWIH